MTTLGAGRLFLWHYPDAADNDTKIYDLPERVSLDSIETYMLVHRKGYILGVMNRKDVEVKQDRGWQPYTTAKVLHPSDI
jgi:hypothetical protein